MNIEQQTAQPRPLWRWRHKLPVVIFIVFCLEAGIFLILFPWTEYWDHNFFFNWLPEWRHLWTSRYLRGAISGLGVLNVYISLLEVLRLKNSAS